MRLHWVERLSFIFLPSLQSLVHEQTWFPADGFQLAKKLLQFSTVAVWTQKTFFPLLIRPQGSQGCQKITFFFLQMKVFSFCAKIALKLYKLQKTVKIEEKSSKKPCFHRHFWIFFNLGAILAHQTSYGMFSGSWPIFWHPWDPWGRVNSGDISVLIFVIDFSVWQSHLADFFHNSQIEGRCHLYWFDMYKNDNVTFKSHNG